MNVGKSSHVIIPLTWGNQASIWARTQQKASTVYSTQRLPKEAEGWIHLQKDALKQIWKVRVRRSSLCLLSICCFHGHIDFNRPVSARNTEFQPKIKQNSMCSLARCCDHVLLSYTTLSLRHIYFCGLLSICFFFPNGGIFLARQLS